MSNSAENTTNTAPSDNGTEHVTEEMVAEWFAEETLEKRMSIMKGAEVFRQKPTEAIVVLDMIMKSLTGTTISEHFEAKVPEKISKLQNQIDTLNFMLEQKDDRIHYLEKQISERDHLIEKCTKWYGNANRSSHGF